MKKAKKVLSILLIITMFFTAACTQPVQNEPPVAENSETPPADNKSEDQKVDVIVIGGGMAGLSSSIEAARLGADVVLLEKLSFLGGSSALCEGYLWSNDAKINNETGQGGFDPETMTQYLYDRSSQKGNIELIKNITGISGEVLDTYMSEGLRMNKDKFMYGDNYNGNLLMALTAPDHGAGMIQDLKQIAENKGVDIRVESPVTGLITENNAVAGVKVESKNGTYNIMADTVIIATGGFVNNDEMMEKYNPIINKHRIVTSTVGAEGDLHEMVLELGGSLVGENVSGTITLDGKPAHNLSIGLMLYGSTFNVNKEGIRWCGEGGRDEDGDNYYLSVNKQTDGKAFAIFDSRNAQVDVLEDAVTKGLAVKADTLEELAEMTGINFEALAKEVETYNNDFAAGRDDSKWGIPNSRMTPIQDAPFYMAEFMPWSTMMTLSGIKVNENCQVLGSGDEPIANLYGAGEFILGNIVNDSYPSCGTALASGLYGGVIAVRHALGK